MQGLKTTTGRGRGIVLTLCALLAALVILRSEACRSDVRPIAPDLVDSGAFEKTDVAAHIGTSLDPERNLLYCATSQVAWNRIRDDLVKAPLEIEGDPPTAQGLNRYQSRGADLPEEASLCMAGYAADGLVDRATNALRQKFGNRDQVEIALSPELNGQLDVAAIAYLEQNLSFESRFNELPRRAFAGGSKVNYFGIDLEQSADKQRRLRDQVRVYRYENKDDFVIELLTDDRNYQLMLAKIPPHGSLLDTVLAAQKPSIRFPPLPIQAGEELAIPVIHVGIEHRFPELFDKAILNLPQYRIKMWQALRFRLDRRGARLKAKAKLEAQYKNGDKERKRSFVFDKPFLVYMKMERQQMPYFALWVANPEILQ